MEYKSGMINLVWVQFITPAMYQIIRLINVVQNINICLTAGMFSTPSLYLQGVILISTATSLCPSFLGRRGHLVKERI